VTYPVIPASDPESSLFKGFWMPDQVRHDGITLKIVNGVENSVYNHVELSRFMATMGI
jgi:hypothetical protein